MPACTTRNSPAGAIGAALVLVLASGCADQPTRPDLVSADPAASLNASAGPVVEQASGSGHFRDGETRRTFTFTARGRLDGTATGNFNVVSRSPAGSRHLQGEITCLRVIGNEAWIGGRNPDGTGIAFRVVDVDQGGGGEADLVSYHYYSPYYGAAFPEYACRSAITLPLNPIDAGEIRVQGERVNLTTMYENDFEAPVGAEWSIDTRSTSPSGETFLGEFSSVAPHGPTLTLSGLPAHRYVRVSLDLYAIRTLDGSDDTFGLDLFTFSEATTGFSFPTTFSSTGAPQAFPGRYPEDEYFGFVGASGVTTLGYVWHGEDGDFPMDATYPVEFTIAHTGPELTFSAIASGLQDFTDAAGEFTDESWGIDNVRVQVLR